MDIWSDLGMDGLCKPIKNKWQLTRVDSRWAMSRAEETGITFRDLR